MTKQSIKVGIVGAGLIGHKRADVIRKTGKGRVVAVSDVDLRKAKKFASVYGCDVEKHWLTLARRRDIDVVIVAVPNKFTVPIACAALKNGKHVLCEKPLGRNAKESQAIIAAAKKYRRMLKVGFNHRFHPAIWRAHELFRLGAIGKLLFIRARYGHGGRLGMEKEWRFRKNISGGGELLDQGVHVIDLARWFAGDFTEAYGSAETKFWKSKVDDNAFAILKNKNATTSLHASTTNWKNIFSFEIFGDKGFLSIDGLGRSYGLETLTFGKRKPTFGVPKIKIFKFTKDTSWEKEWENFADSIRGRGKLVGNGKDGLEANRIVEAIYRSSRAKKVIKLRS